MAFVHAFTRTTPPQNAARTSRQRESARILGLSKRRRRPLGVLMSADKEEEEEKRLQNDQRVVLREFGKISMAAFCIGLVLFFYDILVSLIVVTVGSLYALAVLLEVRGADTLLSRIVGGVSSAWWATKRSVRRGYRAVRREVRKGLED